MVTERHDWKRKRVVRRKFATPTNANNPGLCNVYETASAFSPQPCEPLVSLGNDTTPSAPSLVHYLSRAFQVGPHRFFLTLENETVKGSLGVKRCSLSAVRPRIKVVRGRHELSSRLGVRVIGLLPSQHIPLLSLTY
jgi:hypothetical protein